MSTPNTNPLSYNSWVQQIASMAVVLANDDNSPGVMQFVDAPLQAIVPMILNYAELRIQRDVDLLPSQTTNNTYVLTAGNPVLDIPIDDFLIVQTFTVTQVSDGTQVNEYPLLPVSKEFIQNCYGGAASSGTPRYFAMVGDNFGDGADTFNKVLLGPSPNFAYTLRVTGTIRTPSLFKYAVAGNADTKFTWISSYLPDLLIMASMVYISAFQRNFSATSDSADMGLSYEKAYQALRLGAIPEENRKKAQASGWTPYSTPTAATPTR
jgi:hypothetical protein